MHFPWPRAKITFEVIGKNLTLDIENESPILPEQEGIFEDGDDLSGIYNEEFDYEVIKCVKYRKNGNFILESTYGGFTIIEMNEKTNLCKERGSWTKFNNRRTICLWTRGSIIPPTPQKAQFTCEKETVPFLNYKIDFVPNWIEKFTTKYGALEDIWSRDIYSSALIKSLSADWLYSQDANSGSFQKLSDHFFIEEKDNRSIESLKSYDSNRKRRGNHFRLRW